MYVNAHLRGHNNAENILSNISVHSLSPCQLQNFITHAVQWWWSTRFICWYNLLLMVFVFFTFKESISLLRNYIKIFLDGNTLSCITVSAYIQRKFWLKWYESNSHCWSSRGADNPGLSNGHHFSAGGCGVNFMYSEYIAFCQIQTCS